MEHAPDRVLQGAKVFLQEHRTGLVATAVALLCGFAITAVAVAPMVNDTKVPQVLLTESVVPEGMDAQLAALAAQEMSLTRSDLTRGADTAQSLLARLGVRDAEAAFFIRTDVTARRLLSGRGGKMVQADSDADGQLRQLVARYPSEQPELAKTHFTRLTLSKFGGRWMARLESALYTAQSRLASGSIRSSLFAATDESGLPDGVATQLAEIFAADIDFHRELHKGDTFSLVYETLLADGEPVAWNEGAGRVLAAEFVNGGKAHRALWFTPADGRGAYYDVNGRSKRATFLASPMEFSRITSGFAMRFHPLLQNWRQHRGVDYAAPMGTPVRSVAEGTIEMAGVQSGYGNVVRVRHSDNRSTLYAHLSRIDVRMGQHVEQGQNVGAVGMTGWTTGPHLHFEFQVGGVHQDPLSLAKASETMPLDATARPRFAAWAQVARANLELAETLGGQHDRSE